jgi:hypothetical protein
LAAFINSSFSVSFIFLISIICWALLKETFSLKFLSSFYEIIIASFYKPFSVLALISLNSIAEITPISAFFGESKVPIFLNFKSI